MLRFRPTLSASCAKRSIPADKALPPYREMADEGGINTGLGKTGQGQLRIFCLDIVSPIASKAMFPATFAFYLAPLPGPLPGPPFPGPFPVPPGPAWPGPVPGPRFVPPGWYGVASPVDSFISAGGFVRC